MSVAEVVALADKLSGAGLAVLLLLVLYGGFKKWWVFGYQLTDCEARGAALLEASERRAAEWKELALQGGRVAEQAVRVAKDRR